MDDFCRTADETAHQAGGVIRPPAHLDHVLIVMSFGSPHPPGSQPTRTLNPAAPPAE